jgi:alkaline phosphatase D
MSQESNLSRRRLLAGGAALAATARLAATTTAAAAPGKVQEAPEFRSRWDQDLDRPWLGAEYWAAPLQDWAVKDGAAECLNAAPNRVVHLLTRELVDRLGEFQTSVRVSRPGGAPLAEGRGSCGFRIGIRGPLGDYRNALLYGKGLDVGMTSDGRAFIGKPDPTNPVGESFAKLHEVELELTVKPDGDAYTASLWVRGTDGSLLSNASQAVAADQLLGNVALVCNFAAAEPAGRKTKPGPQKIEAPPGVGVGLFRFKDWNVSGEKVDEHDDREFGPIAFTQYTLSRGTLTLTAQMAPLGEDDEPTVTLVAGSREASAEMDPQARTATFRLTDWDAGRDVPYRVVYALKLAKGTEPHEFAGTIRREPLDRPTLTVADVSCNTHAAFPNAAIVEHMRKLDPDLLAFVGDQFYESSGGYGITQAPLDAAILDYLRKWYLHGWTWRELTRDRPSISLPDDHDVYQGNIWGESGAKQGPTQESGGYRMPAEWVNVCYRTQTSHHPEPYDSSPAEQNILQYYGRMVYGGVDFAILADRMYKTGPDGTVPPTGGRADHVTDPNFDPKTADLPGLQLLGPKQEAFLAEWAADGSAGNVKAVVSQTIFTAMATTHGGPNGRLVADYDTNGWPQTARNRAVRLIRQACAFHIAGDQHLPAVVQYGVDQPRDGSFAFAGPAVNVGYPRWWEPLKPGDNRKPGDSERLGDFRDSFGNWMTVVAFANGSKSPRPPVLQSLVDKTSGLGVVRFNKPARTVTIECWPLDVDPTAPEAKQFAGWPVTIELPTS